jgi:hypothetical protein
MSKVLNPLKLIDRLKARFRLWLKLCPRCNSDAPAIDNCWVCWHGNFAKKSLRIGEIDTNLLKRRWKAYRENMKNEPKVLKRWPSR